MTFDPITCHSTDALNSEHGTNASQGKWAAEEAMEKEIACTILACADAFSSPSTSSEWYLCREKPYELACTRRLALSEDRHSMNV